MLLSSAKSMNYGAPLVSRKGQDCKNAKVFALVNHSSKTEVTKRACIKPARISWLFPLGDGTAPGGSINLVAQKGFILTRLTQAGTVWFPEGHISSRSSVLHNVQVTMIYGSPHRGQHRHNWGTWEERLEKAVHGNMDCDLSSLKDVTQESHSF